jgi:hypothetical protein
MFCLELHATHQKQPEQAIFMVVPACDDLMVDKGYVWLLSIAFLALMVSNQHKGSIESA